MKIDKRIQPLDGIIRYKFTILSFLGVAILGPILNFTLFSISRFDRLFLAIIFMSFAMIMILALTQLFMHVAIQYVNILGRRYKTESTYDPDAAKIAKAIKAPLPKKIAISENPAIDAVTNTLTGTITFSRRLKDLCTRDQFLAVVAHEIGHLKYRKRMILEMLGALGITVLYMILALKILSYVSPVMAELSGLGFFLLLITRIMHSGEFAADKVALDAGLGQHLADVLTKFGDKYGYNKSSETHPSTGSRIKRLLRPQADLPPLVSGLITTPLKRMFDVNWKINFTRPNRYRLNGVTYHALDYAISRNKTELIIIDIGCSTGVATKKMKEDLGKKGISCHTIGVDISAGVEKRAKSNLDQFIRSDILALDFNLLPRGDIVVCSYAALFIPSERKSRIIDSCSKLLKEDGILLTNVGPTRLGPPEYHPGLRYWLGTALFLTKGWSAFKGEVNRRLVEARKHNSYELVGPRAVEKYAESILAYWNSLSRLRKFEWNFRIFLKTPGSHIKRWLIYESQTLWRYVSTLVD